MLNLIVVSHPDDEILGYGGTGYISKLNGDKIQPVILCGQVIEHIWNIDNFVGSGQGNVQIKDRHLNISADSMNIDLNQELILIDKSVILKVKGLN